MSFDPFFSLHGDPEWNATIGPQGDHESYADGYIVAALELAKLILKENRLELRDSLVMPLLYNARHGIELLLKLVISDLAETEIIKNDGLVRNHDIASYFDFLIAAQVPDLEFSELLNELKPYVESLSAVDGNGQAFRYHTDRNEEITLCNNPLANIDVIHSSLETLYSIHKKLRCRTYDLCYEIYTGTYTKCLSRKDLHELVKFLPLRSNWNNENFDIVKDKVKAEFNLSNQQFSAALDKIQTSRELRGVLGEETPLEYLSDEKVLLMAKQWLIIHPRKRKHATKRVLTVEDVKEVHFAPEKIAAYKLLVSSISFEELADAQAIFYLARNGDFSEYYENLVDAKKSTLACKDSHASSLQHLMGKTNFLVAMQQGLKMVGQVKLSNTLNELIEQNAA